MKIETISADEMMRTARLRLPPSLDEATVAHIAPRDRATGEVSDAIVVGLMQAVTVAREEAAALINVEKATLADKTITGEAALLSVANAALAVGTRVAGRLDAARGRARAEIDSILKKTNCPPPPKDAVGLQLEAEIRTALSRTTEAKRKAAIDDAFKAKDLSIIGACLRAPAFLSNLGPAALELYRERYREEFHPGDAKRAAMLTRAVEAADRAGILLMNMVRDASESPTIKLAQAGVRARTEADAALKARGA